MEKNLVQDTETELRDVLRCIKCHVYQCDDVSKDMLVHTIKYYLNQLEERIGRV